jgi:LacI family transcriptional regulator
VANEEAGVTVSDHTNRPESARGRRVTISTIAAEAGVSVPTVSRVVNGRSDVAPQTRERVEELLRRHGYRRRSSRPRSNARLIDLVFNDLDSPWAVEIIRGVEDVAHAAGVGTVVSAIHRKSASARQWLQNLRARASETEVEDVRPLADRPGDREDQGAHHLR